MCHQKETGFPIGPFELGNLIGFDVLSYVHEELGEPYYAPRESSRSSCAGRLGQKSGRGFYAYPEEP